jgi:DNA-binding XRE family transcriptional regulator
MAFRNKFDGKLLQAQPKKTPFSQKEFGVIIDVSRETVSAIENEKQGTIENISMKMVRKWHIACGSYVDSKEKLTFKHYISQHFGI